MLSIPSVETSRAIRLSKEKQSTKIDGAVALSFAVRAARLKADESTRHIPVIVNAAFSQGAVQVERAIAAGAEILHKPTPLKTFQEVAHRHLSLNYAGEAMTR